VISKKINQHFLLDLLADPGHKLQAEDYNCLRGYDDITILYWLRDEGFNCYEGSHLLKKKYLFKSKTHYMIESMSTSTIPFKIPIFCGCIHISSLRLLSFKLKYYIKKTFLI